MTVTMVSTLRTRLCSVHGSSYVAVSFHILNSVCPVLEMYIMVTLFFLIFLLSLCCFSIVYGKQSCCFDLINTFGLES